MDTLEIESPCRDRNATPARGPGAAPGRALAGIDHWLEAVPSRARRSFRLDARELDHLAPFLGFVG